MEPEPRNMDKETKQLFDKVVEVCMNDDGGLDDYGIIDALAHAIVRFSR